MDVLISPPPPRPPLEGSGRAGATSPPGRLSFSDLGFLLAKVTGLGVSEEAGRGAEVGRPLRQKCLAVEPDFNEWVVKMAAGVAMEKTSSWWVAFQECYIDL